MQSLDLEEKVTRFFAGLRIPLQTFNVHTFTGRVTSKIISSAQTLTLFSSVSRSVTAGFDTFLVNVQQSLNLHSALARTVSFFRSVFDYLRLIFKLPGLETEPPVPPGVPGSGGAGSGGGGGAVEPPKKPGKSFFIDEKEVRIEVVAGETKRVFFGVVNNGTEKLSFVVRRGGLREYVTVANREFSLGPGETEDVELIVKAPEEPGVYTTTIIVQAEGVEKEIPLIISVESAKKLFDIKLDIPKRYAKVEAGKEMTVTTTLFNLGVKEAVDVTLVYILKDLEDHVLWREEEIVAVETRASFAKEVHLPSDMNPGKYVLITEVRYGETVGISSATFDVVEQPFALNFIAVIATLFALVFILIALFEILLHHRKKHGEESAEPIEHLLKEGRRALAENHLKEVYDIYEKVRAQYRQISGDKKVYQKIVRFYTAIIAKESYLDLQKNKTPIIITGTSPAQKQKDTLLSSQKNTSFLTHPWFLWCMIFLAVSIVVWLVFVIPQFEKLPVDFTYTADIFSLDNFYDESTQEFIGNQISKTRFSYEVVSVQGDVFVLKNAFDARKITGEKIFAVERLYGIDRSTGEHVLGYGDHDREGWLFAPKNLKKQNYTYWHVNYDSPVEMHFEEEEVIHGLKVYKYAANYHADQTENLGYLPGVPEERGVNLDVNLQTWIEPVTGRMIKYEDHTAAYYYNKSTGERTHPWNNFSNTFTDLSIEEQVKIARHEKRGVMFVTLVVPLALAGAIVLMLFLAWFSIRPFKSGGKLFRGRYLWILFVLGSLGIFLVGLSFGYGYFSPKIFESVTKKPMVIGIAPFVSIPSFEKNVQGFKDALASHGYVEGKNVAFLVENAGGDPNKQLEIIQSFVDKKVDLIYSLSISGTLAAKGVTQEIPIVFSLVPYPSEAGIISSFESSGTNLVGTTNYVPVSRQYDLFEKVYPSLDVLAFVHGKNELSSSLRYLDFKEFLKEKGVHVIDVAAIDLEDLRLQLQNITETIDALYTACDIFIQSGGDEAVIEFSLEHKKPLFSCNKAGVRKGALAGRVVDLEALGRMSGEKAAQILSGTPVSSIPTENGEDEIIINMKTAEKLGLNVSEDLLREASEVIK